MAEGDVIWRIPHFWQILLRPFQTLMW
jgi:hypothetical protein